MSDIELNGHTYVVGRLNARQQFDVLRRLGGVSFWFEQELAEDASAAARFVAALATGAMASLSQVDSDFLLDTCLSVVKRRSGQNLVPVQQGGRLMFENDIDMEGMLVLCDAVMQESLGPFFARRRAERAARSTEAKDPTPQPLALVRDGTGS